MASNDYDLGNYFDKNKVENKITREELKQELFFEFSGFKDGKVTEDIITYAQLINNLLFLKKYTYPDAPNMGIDISRFKFELMTEENIINLKTEIYSQISTYLDDYLLQDLIVKKFNNDYIKNGLGLGFAVSNTNNSVTNFFILVYSEAETRKVVSQIIY